MIVNRDNVLKLLQNLDSTRALRNLFVRELGYDGEGDAVSSDDWPEDLARMLSQNPTFLASSAKDGRFTILHVRLSTAGKPSSSPSARYLTDCARGIRSRSMYSPMQKTSSGIS